MSLQFTHVRQDDGTAVISVFVPGQPPQVAVSDHPNFQEILDGAVAGDESIIDLFDTSLTVATKFEKLSDRVTVANGRVYFDGDELHNVLTEQILRLLNEGADFMPFVRFLDKLMQNPEQHSRDNLYRWLNAGDWSITGNGDIIGYKGIAKDGNGGYVSIHSGRAIVDGEVVTGRIPNAPGSTIEMPRSEVTFDPAVGCHSGLHIGTWDYANSFGRGGVLEVRVNPRDVVSVPTDSGDQKLRACRYEVAKIVSEPYECAYVDDPDDSLDDDVAWGEDEF